VIEPNPPLPPLSPLPSIDLNSHRQQLLTMAPKKDTDQTVKGAVRFGRARNNLKVLRRRSLGRWEGGRGGVGVHSAACCSSHCRILCPRAAAVNEPPPWRAKSQPATPRPFEIARQMGILGLPNVGKSSLFNLLTDQVGESVGVGSGVGVGVGVGRPLHGLAVLSS